MSQNFFRAQALEHSMQRFYGRVVELPRLFHSYWFSSAQKLPLILQTESAECALACLAMVSGYYGHHCDLTYLRQRFSSSSRGMDIQTIIEIADQLNLSARALRLEPDELCELNLPCIVHWEMNHFVVIKKVSSKYVVIHDPARGERQVSLAEVNRCFTGIAFEMQPTKDFQVADVRNPLRLTDFWSRMTGLKRVGSAILFLSLLLQMFVLLAPLYLQLVIDEVVTQQHAELLRVIALGFVLLLILQAATTALREYILLRFQYKLNLQMGANLFRHMIRLPMDYFIKRHVGDIMSRFNSLDKIRDILTSSIVTAVVDGLMALLTLAAMAFYDLKLTAIVVLFTLVYLLIRWQLFKQFRARTQEQIIARAHVNSHFLESVRAIQTIKVFQKENDRLSQWQNRMAEALGKEIKIAAWYSNNNIISLLLFGLLNIAVIYVAVGSVTLGTLSLGMLYAFMAYKLSFVIAMDSLVTHGLELRMLKLHLEQLSDIVQTPTEQQFKLEAKSQTEMNHINGRIEVQNLGFWYSEKDPILFRHLNFTIEQGEIVAITGPSGCGKTTLLKCLIGLLKPTEGKIFIDGVDIQALPHYLPHYRAQIAAVMQEDQLLTGSIADNITCFANQTDIEKVNHCAQMSGIDSEIISMPMQYQTLVGDLGSTLSGGQKQRILLARALYREPRILFMDEATSHLDVTMESRVNHNIGTLNITRVLVAHRPETVRLARKQIELSVYQAEK